MSKTSGGAGCLSVLIVLGVAVYFGKQYLDSTDTKRSGYVPPASPVAAAANEKPEPPADPATQPPRKPQRRTFTLRVDGTPGLIFAGGYMIVSADGSSSSESVRARVPWKISGTAFMVSANAQKQSRRGSLTIELSGGDGTLKSADTDAPYGLVQVTSEIPLTEIAGP